MDKAQGRLHAISSTLRKDGPDKKTDGVSLILPNGEKVDISSPSVETTKHIFVSGRWTSSYQILSHSLSLVLSAVGTPYENSADHVPKFPVVEISSSNNNNSIIVADIWATIYVLFTVYHSWETIPVLFAPSLSNRDEIRAYILESGLGRMSHANPASTPEIFLSRAAFWQGAGTHGYHTSGWLTSSSRASVNAYAPFPNVQSFTRSPLVITAHPLRPQKPRQGENLYTRYCPTVGQTLKFDYFNLDDDEKGPGGVGRHLATFHKWHNDPRVSKGWGEQGPLEKHREYVRANMADPAVWPIMMSWDGELMGYCEVVWAKENHMSQYVPDGARDFDRAIHVLVGEEKFRGRDRAQAWFRSLAHYCFLADPRTQRILGEPKAENVGIIQISIDAGMHLPTVFDFPYKRSVMTTNLRDMFFKCDML